MSSEERIAKSFVQVPGNNRKDRQLVSNTVNQEKRKKEITFDNAEDKAKYEELDRLAADYNEKYSKGKKLEKQHRLKETKLKAIREGLALLREKKYLLVIEKIDPATHEFFFDVKRKESIENNLIPAAAPLQSLIFSDIHSRLESNDTEPESDAQDVANCAPDSDEEEAAITKTLNNLSLK